MYYLAGVGDNMCDNSDTRQRILDDARGFREGLQRDWKTLTDDAQRFNSALHQDMSAFQVSMRQRQAADSASTRNLLAGSVRLAANLNTMAAGLLKEA